MLTPASGVLITELCFLSVRDPVKGVSLCVGTFGYAQQTKGDKGKVVKTVSGVGFSIAYVVYDAFGVLIDTKWDGRTLALAMSAVSAGCLLFALGAHFYRQPLGYYASSSIILLVTAIVHWTIIGGIRSNIKANSTGLEIGPVGDIIQLELAAGIVMFFCSPFVWIQTELFMELKERIRIARANNFPEQPAPDIAAEIGASGTDATSDGPFELPHCGTQAPPLASPPSTPSRIPSPTPSPPRTPPAQIRRARRTWDQDIDLESEASRRAERESIDAAEREMVRNHEQKVRDAIAAQPYPSEVPTGARPVPADITPPKDRVAKWRKATTDAVDPRTLPRWNHDVPE